MQNPAQPYQTPPSRRHFLQRSSALLAALAATSLSPAAMAQDTAAADAAAPVGRRLCLFAKHLQWMDWNELAAFCREIDVAGIEATVRSGGQIEPAQAADRLPVLQEAMQKAERQIVIATTDIQRVDSPHTETVLRTAAILGITHYRMSYYRYDLDQPLLPQLDAFAKQASELAALNHGLGLTGLYQNHAGKDYVGGPLWDLQEVLGSLDQHDLAVAYDVRHATVEGNQTWPIDLRMIRNRIGAVFIKDYRAIDGKIENVALGDGDVSPDLFEALQTLAQSVPVSLHMEYISHTDREKLPDCIEAYRRDRQTLRRLLSI